MVKRKLTDEEKKLTMKGIKRLKKEIEEIEEHLKYLRKTKAFKKIKRKYIEDITPYIQKNEDKEIDNQIKQLTNQMEEKSKNIEIMENQIKNGVEVKNNPAVK